MNARAQREESRLKIPSTLHIDVPLLSCTAELRMHSKLYRVSPLTDRTRTAIL